MRSCRTDRFCQSSRPGILAAPVMILLVGLVWFLVWQLPREPAYRGKALTLWLQAYVSASSSGPGSREWREADDAVRHLGTNSIPVLLHLLRKRDSNLKLWVAALARRQRIITIRFVPAASWNTEASRAFIVLGDVAKGAVPELMRVYNENISAASEAAVLDALTWIGPAAKPAIPLLLGAATNSNARVRANGLWALGEIHAEPELCVPTLIYALSDTDDWARISAAHALGMFGPDARSAVPSLTQLTDFPKASTKFSMMGVQAQLEARNALQKINPRAIAPTSESFPGSEIFTPVQP